MASINLKKVSREPGAISLSEDKKEFQKDGFTYTDIKLDMKIGDLLTNMPTDQINSTADIQSLVDEEAIKQSVSNIFNTVPGQKLLNPYLGLDLKNFLFSPINEFTAKQIADTILTGLVDQEPRIGVENIGVEGVISEETYYIRFTLIFPSLKNKEVNVSGKLTSSGFQLTSENKDWETKKRGVRDRYWDFN
jgi:phage baseplate assembly protein W